ncbi:tRNA pseudouridine synthase 1 [Yamadazyma tenuis]|uniref:tRNA pseudouridine synthase 1 n=1 Tax=Candida tenuis (strain ATCC 10573 / BCRC 21748 / CBS 615 / JCM 9827 / NBRC 10315 / NRRL Y-1498 / VKM Y-70) TaxID=590646 RepID=G3BAF4_CANTC|nr:uncharacterized protein CANTEDRAFT_115504 [Yamadazyma tenuis ATCC 10573]EGV62760.1 hypothetical protein CANTEDRAFT_115504 [Yamadazyma tenuis ATCC 10573]WEJ93294.1 tRNA pseudouridine synthase 1 [Yamadazyma tenuis]
MEDVEVDEQVYKRDQVSKWTRARKEDKRENSNKRQKTEERPDRRSSNNDYQPRVDEEGNVIKSERRPKRKVACMIGYCGTGYNGMQIQNNPDVKTIEGELFQAFINAGAISQENSNDLKKNGFMRAARTDKGVHAAGNVISCKLIIEDEDILQKINKALPEQIRIWGIERTNRSFDCRKMCSSRVYEYLLPTHSFLPPRPGTVLYGQLKEESTANPGFYRDNEEDEKWWKETLAAMDKVKAEVGLKDENVPDADQEKEKLYNEEGQITEFGIKAKKIKQAENTRRRDYKVSNDKLELFRDALKQYEGSHNFHNYTVGKNYKDPSARRYMKSTKVSEPFIIGDTEWVSIKIHGQSFMLHQIRKMIAMAVMLVRTGCPATRINETFSSTRVNIPKAPALGLLLENPVYETYNSMLEKYGYNKIDFSRYQKEMDDFKMKFIYDKIYNEERRENSFHGFFGFIDNFENEEAEYNVFKFLNTKFEVGFSEEKNKDSTKDKDSKDKQDKFDNVD